MLTPIGNLTIPAWIFAIMVVFCALCPASIVMLGSFIPLWIQGIISLVGLGLSLLTGYSSKQEK